MSLKTEPESKGGSAITARGLKLAICTIIAEVGTIKTVYNGEEKEMPKVYFEFQLINGEKIGKLFTFSFYDKAQLAKSLIGWTGSTEFEKDLTYYIGKKVVLSLVEAKQGDKTYVNIDSFNNFETSELKDNDFTGVECFCFDYEDESTYKNLSKIPMYIFKKMETTKEYEKFRQNKLEVPEPQEQTEDLPF